MINKSLTYDYDKTLFALLESNDQVFCSGRAIMSLNKNDKEITLDIKAKDKPAFRAMIKSIEQNILLLNKVRSLL